MQVKPFADLGVSTDVVRALRAGGIEETFPIQARVVPDVLAGRDVLVQSPTGSGKTLAFAVPIVDRVRRDGPRPAALVLAPTRELATQIVAETKPLAKARGLNVAAVYGGTGFKAQIAAARAAQIVVATPGRLEDLIARGDIKLDRVQIVVLDEADRMLDMGFRPPVARIVGQTPAKRQTLFFSATLGGDVGKLARDYTRNPARHEYTPPRQDRGRVDHRFVAVGRERRIDTLVEHLEEDHGRTLVFVRTKRGADRLVKRLKSRGHVAVAMHGDKTQGQRERALKSFHSGSSSTLVATDVAARGIDVDDVTHVINFDAPADRDTYVHRVGRTARAGRSGIGITFVMEDEIRDVGKIAADLRLGREFERRVAA
ncbi:MAG TPA: DEAD/DEAH box helicase [Thermoleophilaceae bacterium]